MAIRSFDSQKLKITNKAGHELGARLDTPRQGAPLAYALFAHCFTCTKNLRAIANISDALNRAGIAVLRFDFTGLGESEGDFADTNFSSNVDDLVAVADYLRAHHAAPQILIGHSLGGAAVIQAAHSIPEAKAVATIGAPCEPTHVKHLIDRSAESTANDDSVTVNIGGRSFQIKQQFLDDLDATMMEETIRNLKRALLVLHAPLDGTVGIENAAHIFKMAKHPKSFISLDTADHLLSDPADSRYAGASIAIWAERYLDVSPSAEDETAVDIPLEGARVAVRTEEGYRTDVVAGKHHFIVDEPESVGGTDLGGTPYDHLLGALGACTSITLRMYANRKHWPLEAVIVRLNHEKLHARDCAECESVEGKVDRIDRSIELIGPLDDEQRARMMEIADKCPVHRTLHTEITVRSTLKE